MFPDVFEYVRFTRGHLLNSKIITQWFNFLKTCFYNESLRWLALLLRIMNHV